MDVKFPFLASNVLNFLASRRPLPSRPACPLLEFAMTNSSFRHVVAGVLIGAFCVVSGSARNGQGEEAKSRSALPLKKVVLFNSGVGFFEHRAQVDGDV